MFSFWGFKHFINTPHGVGKPINPVKSRVRHWADPHAETALTWLILEDRQPRTTGRPALPAVIYANHIAAFLRFDAPVPLIYAIGGRQGDPVGGNSCRLSAVEVFDTWSQTWQRLPSMNTVRVGAAACSSPCSCGSDGGVIVAGGYAENPSVPLDTVEAFCPVEGRWVCKANMQLRRYGLVLLRADADSIYAMGGSSGTDVCGAVERYSIKDDCWTARAPLPEPLAGGRGVQVRGYLLYVGGYTPNGRLSNRIFIYDPAADSWVQSKVLLRLPRTTFALGFDVESDTILLAGGQAPTHIEWLHNRWYDTMPDHFSVSADVEPLSVSAVLSLQPIAPACTLPCLPSDRTGCLGVFLKDYGFVVIGGEQDGDHIMGKKTKASKKDWTEVLVCKDDKWNKTFPQPLTRRVAFSIVHTFGYPPC